ncbi:Polypeptide N-acetylgalactosaminyltransferase-like protein 2 [Chelonia mydas]|uniref:Polypeptide N-acetylgalactosaminyltransferase-like protein 2 n=1 Tax=Chelonia mydas TaxID=8469 RepID=M7BVV1_CHEMY|nr:Polypeptide N-acetylgalactosaminyltransferase-like protein 2 [Chelonia mydas]
MVTILNPPFRDLNKEGTSQPLKFSAREGYQLDFPETQEMLETQEESQQYYPMVGLAPFISLREDELLVAIVSPIARRNDSKARKGYRMVKQQSKRQEEKTNVKPRGNQESQLMSFPLQDSEEAAGGEQLAILGLETHGFNEALSERISLRRELPEVRHPLNRIVSPVIDVIDWKTFQYHHSVDLQRGGFDWKLDFHWEPLPEHEEKVRQSAISPIRSPVVPGGVVAMDRHYFQNIGAYDSDMTLWGAENLELSIRAWLCGGSVEILPCSRVGHIFRNHIPHTFPNEEAAVRNKIRIAETWLDSFKEIFYKHDTVAFLISKLYNTGVGFCADYRSAWGAAEGPIELSPCSDNINQHFEYNSMKEIRFGSALQFCFDVRNEKVILQNCTQEAENNQQQWDVQESGMIVHILSGKCLEAVKIEAEKDLSLHVCNKNENQLWRFDHSHVLDER